MRTINSVKSINYSPYKNQSITINFLLFYITLTLYELYNDNKKSQELCEIDTFEKYVFAIDEIVDETFKNDVIYNSKYYKCRDIMCCLNNLYIYDKLMYDKLLFNINDKSENQYYGSCLSALVEIETNKQKITDILNLLNNNHIYDKILNICIDISPSFIEDISETFSYFASYFDLKNKCIDRKGYDRSSDFVSYYDLDSNKQLIKAAFSYIPIMLSKYNIFSNNISTFEKSIELAKKYKFTNVVMIKYKNETDNELYDIYEFIKRCIINKKQIGFDLVEKLKPILPLDKRY